MSPRIQTSEPAYRGHMSQWQRDRAGRVEPMAILPVSHREARWTCAVVVLATVAVAVCGVWP